MFQKSIEEVLFLNVELGSGFPTDRGPSTLCSLTPEKTVQLFLDEIKKEAGISTLYFAPQNREELLRVIRDNIKSNTLVISTDNAVSYAIFRALSEKNRPLRTNIVLDQHMDIYSYRTHGKSLTKANPYRIALDEKLIQHIIFVGTRLLEEAFLNPYILLGSPRHFLDLPYAWFRYRQGQHSGLEKKTDILPVSLHRNFAKAAAEAIRLVENYHLADLLQGVVSPYSFGLEIDLDVFDSQEIRGVDYGVDLPARISQNIDIQFRHSSFLKKPTAFIKFLYNHWVTSYIKHKIECAGLSVPCQKEIKQVMEHIAKAPLVCGILHITELKLEHDDPEKKTATLVKNLVKSAVEVSKKAAKC